MEIWIAIIAAVGLVAWAVVFYVQRDSNPYAPRSSRSSRSSSSDVAFWAGFSASSYDGGDTGGGSCD